MMQKSFTLDAGHGGSDPGAVGNGVIEKVWALDFVKRLRARLEKGYQAKIILSRSDDSFVALGDREEPAKKNKCDAFFSFHNNAAADASANGFESFRQPEAPEGILTFQTIIHNEVFKYLSGYGTKDRGVKTKNLQVLRESTSAKIPAILFENLFLSNMREAALLKDSQFVDGLADAYARGIARAFSLTYTVNRTGVKESILAEDLKILQDAGVVTSPEYWQKNAVEGGYIDGKYAGQLIANMAKNLK